MGHPCTPGKCCCCVELRTGVITIGVLHMLAGAAWMVLGILNAEGEAAQIVSVVIASVAAMLMGLLLVVGAYKRNQAMLGVHVALGVLSLVLGIIGLILIFVFLDDVKDTLEDEGVDTTTFFIVFAVAYGVSTVVFIYFLTVVYGLILQIRREDENGIRYH